MVKIDLFCCLALTLLVAIVTFCCVAPLRFMALYHPTNLAHTNEEATAHLRSRLSAFTFLLESGRLDGFSLCQEQTKEIVKVMDTGEEVKEGS